MPEALPTWTPFSAEAPPASPEVGDEGRLVALAVTRQSATSDWPGQAALQLAEAWRESGLRVVLADGGVAGPSLHRVLGLEVGEGITDAVLFGASPSRIARPVPGRKTLFTSAGTTAASASMVFEAPRWRELAAAFRKAGATLLLYLPMDQAPPAELLASMDEILVLGRPGDDLSPWSAYAGRVRACLHPPEAAPREEELSDPLDPFEVDPLAPTAGHREVPLLEELLGEEASPPGSEAPAPAAPNRRRWLPAGVIAAGLAVAALAFAIPWWSGGSGDPVDTAPSTTAPEATPRTPTASEPEPEAPAEEPGEAATPPAPVDDAAPPQAAASAEVTSPLLGYSVSLASFDDREDAEALRRQLSGRPPRGFLHLAPVEVGGASYFRVLLGPALDRADADAMAEALAEEIGDDPDRWIRWPTELAFALGDFSTPESARTRIQEWETAGIPAYLLEVVSDDGARIYRVYAGAYRSPGEATELGAILADAGMSEAPLVRRVGEPVGG